MLKQQFVLQFGSSIGLKIVGLLAGIFVARYAGPQVVGSLSYGIAYVSVFLFIAEIWGSPHIKLISEGVPLPAAMGTYIRLKFGSMVVYLIIVSGFYLVQKYLLHYQFENELEIIIWLSLMTVLISSLFNITSNTYVAKLEQTKALYPKVVGEFIYQLGRIVVVILGFKALTLVTWNLISSILIFPIFFKLLLQLPYGKWDSKLAKRYVRIALPLLLVVFSGSMMRFVDKIFLQYFTNTTELGYYGAAFAVGGLITEVGRSAGIIFFPMFSNYIAQKDWENINNKNWKYQEFIVIFIFPLTCILAIIGKPFITIILGNKYLPSAIPFSILLFASYTSIVGIPYGNIIAGSGRFYTYAIVNLIKVFFFVITIFVFVSPSVFGLGAIGLALTVLLLNIFENLLYIFISKKIGKIKSYFPNNFRYLIIFICSILFFLFSLALKQKIEFWWFGILIGYIIVTYSFLYITKLVNNENFMMFLELMNIKRTLTFIKSELNKK